MSPAALSLVFCGLLSFLFLTMSTSICNDEVGDYDDDDGCGGDEVG